MSGRRVTTSLIEWFPLVGYVCDASGYGWDIHSWEVSA